MSKESHRTRRVGHLIQHELATIFQREINQTKYGMLTVSDVDIAPDLKTAKVYVSILANQVSHEAVIEHLNEQMGHLRHHLSQRLAIRTTPKLQFIRDTAIEEGNRLSNLINTVTKKEQE